MADSQVQTVQNLFSVPALFVEEGHERVVEVTLLSPGQFESWALGQAPAHRALMAEQGFSAAPGKLFCLHDEKGSLARIVIGTDLSIGPYDISPVPEFVRKTFSPELISSTVFRITSPVPFSPEEAARLSLGWALGCYAYGVYREKPAGSLPRLIWPEGVDRRWVESVYAGITLTRHLVNTPANDLGPAELQETAEHLTKMHGASLRMVSGEDLVQDFPLIHAVGKGSPRAPRLIDLTWGCAEHPRVTLVGKGVCFDTGGLNLKPGSAMSLMKKDMGGAAHALGLAHAIMGLDLPIRLRVLVPAVENSVSGESFRPRDVIRSRKGLSVEILDTDAEGRLVLADALSLACEEKTDLIVDFATLTGAARVALGFDIPALFGNRPQSVGALKDMAAGLGDPLWELPLWRPYLKEMDSDIADIANIGSGPAGCIQAALFLERFVSPGTDWIHIDQYAWEQAGRPGRPKGGCDMGLRAVLAYLTKRFSS